MSGIAFVQGPATLVWYYLEAAVSSFLCAVGVFNLLVDAIACSLFYCIVRRRSFLSCKKGALFIKCAVVELVKNALRVNRGIIGVYHEISLRLQELQKRHLPLLGCF